MTYKTQIRKPFVFKVGQEVEYESGSRGKITKVSLHEVYIVSGFHTGWVRKSTLLKYMEP